MFHCSFIICVKPIGICLFVVLTLFMAWIDRFPLYTPSQFIHFIAGRSVYLSNVKRNEMRS